MRQKHKNTITQNKLKQLKPRFGRLLQPGNRAALFTKKKVSNELDNKGKISKEKRK